MSETKNKGNKARKRGPGRPFQPGPGDERINRKGRPRRGTALSDVLREVGTDADREAVARKIWAMAREGNLAAAAFIFDRLEGKVQDRIAVEHENNSRLLVVEEVVAVDGEGKPI